VVLPEHQQGLAQSQSMDDQALPGLVLVHLMRRLPRVHRQQAAQPVSRQKRQPRREHLPLTEQQQIFDPLRRRLQAHLVHCAALQRPCALH